ncbi:hypothetical protein A0J52_11515 [Clostridium sporogenes]|jgi:hypothetical protein|uniref:hypothetical protein n=1 Tax=Clostridium TaxID=1485 RepID=UPI0007800859|nr:MULTISPECIES: hypothetical protein [Clostridium]KYN77468.1 hypothetical protein A0J52_11515 [Clostridium sporogenes]MBE6056130.1 hypothetical protein [Clostridium sp.]
MEKSLQEQQIEALETANEYIPKLINGINMCIDSVKDGKQDEALNLLSYIVEGIEWLNEVARLTKDIQKTNVDEEMMREKLEEISNCVDKKEYDRIFHILKDEILSILSLWQDNVKKSILN